MGVGLGVRVWEGLVARFGAGGYTRGFGDGAAGESEGGELRFGVSIGGFNWGYGERGRTLNCPLSGDGRMGLRIDWNWRCCKRNGEALGQRNMFAIRSTWNDGLAILDVHRFTTVTQLLKLWRGELARLGAWCLEFQIVAEARV